MSVSHWWINDISPIDDKSSFPPALRRTAHACVCSDGWATRLLTPHPALLTWEVMPRRSNLHLCHFMPCLMPARTASDCPARTFHHFFLFFMEKNQISCQHFDVPHIFLPVFVSFYSIFSRLLLYLAMWHVAFRQMRMRSFWLSIIYYNCPLRKARRDSPTIRLCLVWPDSLAWHACFHLGAFSERMLIC